MSNATKADDVPDPDADTPAKDRGRPRGRRRARAARAGIWLIATMSLAVAILAVIGWSLLGKPLRAPDWLRQEIAARLAEQMPGYALSFSDMTLFVQPDLRPEIALSNVELYDGANDRKLLEVSQVGIAFARRSLLQGQIQPSSVSVSGVFLQLNRTPTGEFDLAFGDGLGQTGLGVNGLIAQIDEIVFQPRFSALRTVDVNAVTLAYQDARAGQSWTVDGGHLDLSRENEILQLRGDFALLSGRSYASTLEIFGESAIGSNAVSLGVAVTDVFSGDIASQSAALAWLGVLRAPISGALRTSFNEDGALGPLSATLGIGAGVVQPTDATRPIPFSDARAFFTYDPQEDTLRFSEFEVVSEWVNAKGEGSAVLENVTAGLPSALQGQVKLSEISANPGDIYDAPRSLSSADLDFHLALNPFVLRIGRLTLVDKSQPLRLRGRIAALPLGWDISMMAQADEIKPGRLLEFWPADIKPGTRSWISNNVLDGALRNVAVRLRARPGDTKPDLYASGEVAEARVQFMKHMPPVTGASGLLQLEDHRLVVSIDKGDLVAGQGGQMAAGGTVFTIPDVRIPDSPAEVDIAAEGPIQAALWLLNQKPLEVLDRGGKTLDLASGTLRVGGKIKLPLKKKVLKSDVEFAVQGRVFDVISTEMIPNKVLAADVLRVSADNQTFRIAGAGTVEGVPFDGFWQTPIAAEQENPVGRVEADVAISQEFLEAFAITLPPGSLSGRGSGRLSMDLQKDVTPEFSLSSDLVGLGLKLDAIGWSKPTGAKGALQINGTLGTPARLDRLSLSAPGLDMEGSLALAEGGGLRSLAISRLRVGGWLDAPVTLTGRGAGAAPAVLVGGGKIDMRNAPFTSTKGGGGGASATGGGTSPLTLAPDRLQISDGIILTDFRGDFTTQTGMRGNFSARLNGGTPVRGTVEPTNKGSQFVIKSDDAGGTLRDAGLLKNVQGGSFVLKLLPTGATGTFDGELDIRDTRIRNAPVMAELLNAISVIGLLDQLGGQGIAFGEVEARFRLTPKQVILTRSSATGPSMGISLDGYYDLGSGTMDMQGVVSPIYVVNFVGQIFSRKGEGLIGFNFNLKGKSDNPRIQVNPLSALTPGMFREIFRRPPPKVQQ
ncbi:DUF3971 domain-containing protein [Marinovum sp. 2_MG-2023]|nr:MULTISPECIES: DUF3971 domain-containing protein [unclassified Marinovum]MDO6730417.1 DUF3971 domain-containing protein [Marinovum sp. 2_MG-2023]MDO6778397.1 DUF3971 domain-containing protein [Marinovum sp. 1_MG-2023]